MKEKKIAKQMRKWIKWITKDRDALLAQHDLLPHEQQDLKDFNESITHLTYVHNYFSVPSKHI